MLVQRYYKDFYARTLFRSIKRSLYQRHSIRRITRDREFWQQPTSSVSASNYGI
jgi:hypothetical protein